MCNYVGHLKKSVLSSLYIFIVATALSGCGAPLFRSDGERFAPEPEVIEQVQQYLSRWATLPPDETLLERQRVAVEIESILWIQVINPRITTRGKKHYTVEIVLDVWGDWIKGYYYVENGDDLVPNSRTTLRQVDDHLYVYNRNE